MARLPVDEINLLLGGVAAYCTHDCPLFCPRARHVVREKRLAETTRESGEAMQIIRTVEKAEFAPKEKRRFPMYREERCDECC